VLIEGAAGQEEESSGPPSGTWLDFDAVARNHASALLSHATRLTRRRFDAWDLVQDTFERALSRPPRALEPVKVRCWLFVVMHNLHRDRCRSAARRRCVALNEEALAFVPDEDRQPLPQWRSIEAAELSACLDQLEPRLREPYELQVEHGMTLAAIAERLGIPVATVGTRVFRARRKLRRLLTATRR
jgi:RNA polymerase sigma-70 factor (ECF subfamily)